MMRFVVGLAVLLNGASAPTPTQDDCLHGIGESAEQSARRRDALALTRYVNTAQANQAGARDGKYLSRTDLNSGAGVEKLRASRAAFAQLSFAAGADVIPGWELTLDATTNGYWLMIKDKTDSCGFAYVSNQDGLIYTAQHLR